MEQSRESPIDLLDDYLSELSDWTCRMEKWGVDIANEINEIVRSLADPPPKPPTWPPK